jgi:hypothetical protein
MRKTLPPEKAAAGSGKTEYMTDSGSPASATDTGRGVNLESGGGHGDRLAAKSSRVCLFALSCRLDLLGLGVQIKGWPVVRQSLATWLFS